MPCNIASQNRKVGHGGYRTPVAARNLVQPQRPPPFRPLPSIAPRGLSLGRDVRSRAMANLINDMRRVAEDERFAFHAWSLSSKIDLRNTRKSGMQ